MLAVLLPLVAAMTQPVPDMLTPLPPSAVHLTGYLSPRLRANTQRLLEVDPEPLLAGYRVKPGSHPWIGEHIGKWMHAAALAYENETDTATKTRLHDKLAYAAAELVKAQEPDGYLGTYPPDKRFGLFEGADWDVWSHKYSIIGLLAYHRVSGDAPALAAARRAADLLIATFGPGKKSIVSAGTHMGMAATSVLEPIVQLYRATGDQKYLAFAQHIVASYNDENGPRLLDTLLAQGSVAATANGKSYEMLSNCVGLCELYRATADRRFLDAARNAFDDIVANQLYITGTASHYEHFYGGPKGHEHDLPNAMAANVGETCVTVTWIQLCEQLLRLTAEPKYADELERAVYNHLAAAQHPQHGDWCYYTSLDGTKPYTSETCCCLSSGPRAMAMIPSMTLLSQGAAGRDHATLVVNLFESCSAVFEAGATHVGIAMDASLFKNPHATLTFTHDAPSARFAIKIRPAPWAEPLTTPGVESVRDADGWCLIPEREWKNNDTLRIDFASTPRIVRGSFGNAGKAAVTYGPLVMAFDNAQSGLGVPSRMLWLNADLNPHPGDRESNVWIDAAILVAPKGTPARARLVPFALAGVDTSAYRVWLGAPGSLVPGTLPPRQLAVESRSRAGNVSGSILDEDPRTCVVTFDSTRPQQDWYAVEFHEPRTVSRITFRHGRTFHDGGWFDTATARVRIEIQRTPASPWEPVGTLDAYPRTSPTDAGDLKSGQAFTTTLATPASCTALRVVGVPAHGDNPAQAFSSCAELWAE
jgi:DUF1680 family protein